MISMKKILIGILTLSLLTTTSLASFVQTGSSCSVSDDCPDLHDCTQNVCVNKSLFPITFREVVGTFIILIINALLNAGGVAAGSAFIPFIMLLFNVNLQRGVFIAFACMFGGGIGNVANIITLKSSITKRYLTNYNVSIIALPAMMVGVIIGCMLGRFFAPFMANVIVMVALVYSVYKNYLHLRSNLVKERKNKTEASPTASPTLASPAQFDEKVPSIPSTPELEFVKQQDKKSGKFSPFGGEVAFPSIASTVLPSMTTTDKVSRPMLQSKASMAYLDENENENEEEKEIQQSSPRSQKRTLLLKREQQFPVHKFKELIVNMIITALICLSRGSKGFAPVFRVDWSCGWDFAWFTVGILVNLNGVYGAVKEVIAWQKEKVEAGIEFLPEDPMLDKPRMTKLVAGSIIAGIIGGLVAFGGSMIMGPILMDMKMPPVFSAATTGVFMIAAMFASIFMTTLEGDLNGVELAWFLCLSFLFSFAVSKLVNWYVKKTGRQSLIVLLTIIGTLLGFLSFLAISSELMVKDFDNQVAFNNVC